MIRNIQYKLDLSFLVLSVCVNQASLGCLFNIYKNKLNNWGFLSAYNLSSPFIWLFLLNTNNEEKNAKNKKK